MGTRRNYQRTSNKNDSPLHVLPVAERLIDYTLNLTDNANRFPKRVRFSITNKIQGHVMAIYDDLLEANEIFPIRTEADRTERLRLQRTALTECKKLLHMIELSKKRTYIDKDTFDYWTKLTLDVKFMTAKWYKAEQDTAHNAAGQSWVGQIGGQHGAGGGRPVEHQPGGRREDGQQQDQPGQTAFQ